MNKAIIKNDAIIYDNNPESTKFIPKGEIVELIGTPIDNIYITVRYKGFNCLLNLKDLKKI